MVKLKQTIEEEPDNRIKITVLLSQHRGFIPFKMSVTNYDHHYGGATDLVNSAMLINLEARLFRMVMYSWPNGSYTIMEHPLPEELSPDWFEPE